MGQTFLCLRGVSLVAFLLASAASGAERPYETATLKNGLDVVTMESHKVPLVTIVLASKAGAMTESPDTNGLTHLWEHMFFKGNKRIPNQEAFRERIQELGITYNGDTSAEKVRYYFTLPSTYLEEGLQFMADAIMTPLIDEKELERERHVVLDEYDRNASQPEFDLYRLQRRLIYGAAAHQRDPLGVRTLIASATRDQLMKIKDDVFVPKNSAILVSGDFDPKKLDELVRKYFDAWENPQDWKAVQQPALPPFPESQEVVMTHKDARDVRVQFTFKGPRARAQPKDSFAADVLISMLNQRSGKFYKKYLDTGLTHFAGLSYYTQSHAGELDLYAGAAPDKIFKVKEMLLKEPKEWLKKDYFTQEQLEDVRRNLAVGHQFEVNKPSEYVKNLAFWWAVTGLDYYGDYIPNLRKISLEDVRAFVREWMIDKPSVRTMFLSPEDAKTIGVKDNAAPLVNRYLKS